MTALAEAFERDPRVLRIAMVEMIGVSPSVTKVRNDLLEDFVLLLAGAAVGFGDIDEAEADLLSVGLLGAANELLMRWTTGQASRVSHSVRTMPVSSAGFSAGSGSSLKRMDGRRWPSGVPWPPASSSAPWNC